jgi:hypothetical protein
MKLQYLEPLTAEIKSLEIPNVRRLITGQTITV